MSFLRDFLRGSLPSQTSSSAIASEKSVPKEEFPSNNPPPPTPPSPAQSPPLPPVANPVDSATEAPSEDTSPQARALKMYNRAWYLLAHDANSENTTNHFAGLEALAEAADLDPKFLEPRLLLAQLLHAGDPVKRAKEIVEFATQAYVIDPRHRETMLFLADILEIDECRKEFVRFSQGTYKDDEIDDFIVELRAEPSNALTSSQKKDSESRDHKANEASARIAKAVAHSALEEWEKELVCHDRVLQLLPEDANTHFNRGLVLRRLGRRREAIESFDQALKINPRDTDCLYNKGAALHDLRDFDDAITCYERVVAIDPHYANAWGDMGDACEMINDWDGAIESYRTFIELVPAESEERIAAAELRVRMLQAVRARGSR
jgi:tetratricopeptide (TPR) repeat protein